MLAHVVSLALLTLSLLSDVAVQEAVPSACPLRVRSVVFAGSCGSP
jgi:hypothetical protein